MMQRQLLQRRPLLPVMANELPFILADRTSWRRLRGLAKLRPALYADKVLRPPPNLLPQPPRRTGERPLRSEERGISWPELNKQTGARLGERLYNLTDVNRGCDRVRSDRKTDHLPGAGLNPHR